MSAARSGLEHPVTINLALTRQAKILLPLHGCRMSKLEATGAWRSRRINQELPIARRSIALSHIRRMMELPGYITRQ